MKKLRVILADDHALVRAGIRALIENLADVEVVGEAGNGAEALEIIEQTSPNLALLDIGMPGINGLGLTERVSRDFPSVHVLILSMHCSQEYVTYALRAGAAGYLVKEAAAGELSDAIHAVARGNTYLSPAASKTLVESFGRSDQSKPKIELTARQLQVLEHIVEGNTTKEIAFTLGISVKTVEAHRAQLMERLGIDDVPGLVRYAMRIGLARPEPPEND